MKSLLKSGDPFGFTNAAYAGKPFRQLLQAGKPDDTCYKSGIARRHLLQVGKAAQSSVSPKQCLPNALAQLFAKFKIQQVRNSLGFKV
ncbi:MAG TPA: hypothetical protein IGS40_20040 [Trichormus sp. M33_DOE_039]|nr:hypothetical protein [Trichormus sp. M33_DOE_039]